MVEETKLTVTVESNVNAGARGIMQTPFLFRWSVSKVEGLH